MAKNIKIPFILLIFELSFDSVSFAVIQSFYKAIYHVRKQIQYRSGYDHDDRDIPSIHCFWIL